MTRLSKEESLATTADALGYTFKGTEYTTAQDKAKVIKTWRTFITKGFQFEHFTDRLYTHLMQHCAFIAHYNRLGFYETYFCDPAETIRFLWQFDSDHGCRSIEYGDLWWMKGENEDINEAMIAEFGKVKAKVYGILQNKLLADRRARLALMQAEVNRLEQTTTRGGTEA